jgi:hypothetical protein
VSTESIASPPSSVGAPEPCTRCGAPLAEDQRYCLECGERRTPMSSVLAGGPPSATAAHAQPAVVPPPGAATPSTTDAGRGNAVTVIAGVGVLLLAMGVGVLIGRAGSSKPGVAPPQVISVASSPASTTSTGQAAAAPFTDDWPAGTNGYTVQLQTLPRASTQVSAVEAAKSAAGTKGAKGVGALKSEDFSSLTAGNYVIYSGVYHKQAEASKALGALAKRFPGSKVIKVSAGAGASSSSPATSGSGGAGSSGVNKSAPTATKAAETLTKAKNGKSYEEESKKLPNVVETP